MYCPKCGAETDEQAAACSQCGAILRAAPADAVAQKIPNYLAQSILVTLLCCLPLGIPAIVFAAQVNGKVQAGDIAGAQDASRKAKMWCWWSLGIGLVAITIQIIAQIFVATSAAAAY
jgi:uncharacterized membrane protein YvbJ